MLEVYLIRHGRTAMNSRGLLQGRGSDLPLDACGVEQARSAAVWARQQGLSFDRVVSSPLRRAVQTAAIVGGVGEEAVEKDDLLLEMDYGPWEGYDMSRRDPAVEKFFSDFVHNPAPEGMESLSHVRARAAEFLRKLSPDGGRVLVATHAILLKGALETLDPSSGGGWWSRRMGNCWVYRSVNCGGGLSPAELVYSGRAPESA